MQTWIFQGNPDLFNIDVYLAAWLPEFPWLVTRHGSEIARGDQVFIWRTAGASKGVSGIVAEAVVTAEAELREEDPLAKSLWRGGATAGDEKRNRALLRLNRIATTREVLQREWLVEDPILRDMHNIRMASGTNFRVTPLEATRLNLMWARIGQDWTRDESVAGLWAYMKTRGTPISRLPGSLVAQVSELTGRPVSGVYNKVMNYRALDPRDARAGLSGAGDAAKRLWSEFYDDSRKELRESAVEVEFARLWTLEAQAVVSAPTTESVESTARLFEVLDLPALLGRYSEARKVRPERPAVKHTQTRAFDRDPLAVAITRKRAGYRCEVPGCSHTTFITAEGRPYHEVHHIVPLGEGGNDTIANMACVCPSHHREAHFGSQRFSIAEALTKVRMGDASPVAPHDP